MRDASGKLADHLELLDLPQLFLCEGALRAFLDNFLIGLFKGCGALPNAVLQCRIRLGQPFAVFMEIGQPGARLILSPAPAQRRFADAQQRRRMKRSLKKTYVTQYLKKACGRGIALDTSAFGGEQNEREVRPFGLLLDP